MRGLHLLAATAAVLLLAGCGGGSSASRTDGQVIDTYVAGATVFADLNANGIHDADEPSALSDSMGRFALAGVPEGTMLYSVGGSETLAGEQQTVRYVMAAKKQSDQVFITPLSTLNDLGSPELLPRLLQCDAASAQRNPMLDPSTFLAAQQAAVLLELYSDQGVTPAALVSKLHTCESLEPGVLETCMGGAPEGVALLTQIGAMDASKIAPENFEVYEQVFRAYTLAVSGGFIPLLGDDLVSIVESGESEALLRSWRADDTSIEWHGTVSAPPMPRHFGSL